MLANLLIISALALGVACADAAEAAHSSSKAPTAELWEKVLQECWSGFGAPLASVSQLMYVK
jgi:hypothetical protein